ncbi:YceI family protein [Staphylococcus auricularis]|uniref:YceI family protein n=1 Tax=Staphylococcus auricularis TaxID=29379 RepID=UPI00242C1CF5|nr:YceI family protein [Staphylococcus auricularis]
MTQFNFDPAHSSVDFSIKHLMISNVKGRFEDFDAQFEGDINDLSTIKGTFTIKVNSIDTRDQNRDEHLLTDDFFSAEQYPEIKFEIEKVEENSVTGQLTIKGETHEETFDGQFEGVSKNPMNGAQTAGYTVNGTIDREKYGITFNQALETGGVMLGKEVKFQVSVEAALEDE